MPQLSPLKNISWKHCQDFAACFPSSFHFFSVSSRQSQCWNRYFSWIIGSNILLYCRPTANGSVLDSSIQACDWPKPELNVLFIQTYCCLLIPITISYYIAGGWSLFQHLWAWHGAHPTISNLNSLIHLFMHIFVFEYLTHLFTKLIFSLVIYSILDFVLHLCSFIKYVLCILSILFQLFILSASV